MFLGGMNARVIYPLLRGGRHPLLFFNTKAYDSLSSKARPHQRALHLLVLSRVSLTLRAIVIHIFDDFL